MTQGTTPSYIFRFKRNLDFSEVALFQITLQSCRIEVTHTSDDECVHVDAEQKTITLTLTQAETLQFKEGEAEVQVRGRFRDGTAFASKVYRVPVNRSLNKEVI